MKNKTFLLFIRFETGNLVFYKVYNGVAHSDGTGYGWKTRKMRLFVFFMGTPLASCVLCGRVCVYSYVPR